MLVVAIPNRQFPPSGDALALAGLVLDSLDELTPEALLGAVDGSAPQGVGSRRCRRSPRGFLGRRRTVDDPSRVPPGQYVTDGLPGAVRRARRPTRRSSQLELRDRRRGRQARESWSWEEFLALPAETPTVDIHCVTKWSKLDTPWTGVSVDTLLDAVQTEAEYLTAWSDGGYTTNLPLDDVPDGKAWVAYEYDGEPLEPEHGGPARLLVPHLYFWKSAKWVRGLTLTPDDEPGFWETYGYHNYGDPWLEQRYQGD